MKKAELKKSLAAFTLLIAGSVLLSAPSRAFADPVAYLDVLATEVNQAQAEAEVQYLSAARTAPSSRVGEDHYYDYQIPGQRSRRVHALTFGRDTNPPVLLLHGTPGDAKTWLKLSMEGHVTEDFHLIAVDRPGSGGSPGAAVTDMKDQAAILVEALKLNKSGKKAIVVGYSYGAPLAAQMALDFPNAIGSLVLAAGVYLPGAEPVQWYHHVLRAPILRWFLPRRFVAYGNEAISLDQELAKLRDQWANLHIRTIVIQGLSNHLYDSDAIEFLKNSMSPQDLTVLTYPGLDHLVATKRPSVIVEQLYLLSR